MPRQARPDSHLSDASPPHPQWLAHLANLGCSPSPSRQGSHAMGRWGLGVAAMETHKLLLLLLIQVTCLLQRNYAVGMSRRELESPCDFTWR